MFVPVLLSSSEWLWLKVGYFPFKGLSYFKPMGRISKVLWNIQRVIYSPIFMWSKPTDSLNFKLIKNGKEFTGSINNVMSYIFLDSRLKMEVEVEDLLLSEIHLGKGYRISSPQVIEVCVEKKANKVRFIRGSKALITDNYKVLFPIMKDLYSQGKLTSYSKRIGKSHVNDMMVYEGVCHGDFAAFNMLFSKDKIVLIDWSDSFHKGPILYDLIYYFISSAVFFKSTLTLEILRVIVMDFILYIEVEYSGSFLKNELDEILRIWKDKGVNPEMVLYLQNLYEENSNCS